MATDRTGNHEVARKLVARKPATITDVAAMAGVSPKTVSNFVNKTAPVKDETATRIARAIAELRYAPHSMARRFRTGKTNVIGFVAEFSILDQPITHYIECELQRRLARSNYSLEIIVSDEANQTPRIDPSTMDGLIIASAGKRMLAALVDLDIPVIHLRRLVGKNYHTIVVDDHKGGVIAGDYLMSKGHSQIGLLTNQSDFVGDDFQLRRQGCVDALAARGMRPCFELSPPVVKDQVQQWLEAHADDIIESGATAVFATTDLTALSLNSLLYRRGVSVPRDISIIGFDNIDFASLSIPPLTTVGGQWDRLANLAAQHIIAEIEANEQDNFVVTLEPQLYERESVRQV